MKKQITLRVDGEVLDWFRKKKGYTGLMSRILKDYYLDKSGIENAVTKIREKLKDLEPKNDNPKSQTKYSQKYKDKNPNKRCPLCYKILRFCSC